MADGDGNSKPSHVVGFPGRAQGSAGWSICGSVGPVECGRAGRSETGDAGWDKGESQRGEGHVSPGRAYSKTSGVSQETDRAEGGSAVRQLQPADSKGERAGVEGKETKTGTGLGRAEKNPGSQAGEGESRSASEHDRSGSPGDEKQRRRLHARLQRAGDDVRDAWNCCGLTSGPGRQ